MKRYTEREIRDLLTSGEVPRPPADLAELIKSEIPDSFAMPQSEMDMKKANFLPFLRRPKARIYLLAASLAMTLGGAFFAYRVHQRMMSPDPFVLNTRQAATDFEATDFETLSEATALKAAAFETLSEANIPEANIPEANIPEEANISETSISEASVPEASVSETSVSETGYALADHMDSSASVAPQVSSALPADSHLERRLAAESEAPSQFRRPYFQTSARASQKLMSQPFEIPKPTIPNQAHFIDTRDDSLSTFSLDVETASYSVMRLYLSNDQLPPPEAVKVEQLINYFEYGDTPPTEEDFVIHAEGAPSLFGEREHYHLLRFHLRGRDALQTIATEAWAQIHFNPEVVSRYRLVGYENQNIADGRFLDDRVNAGEIGAGHAVTALYEIEFQDGAGEDVSNDETKIATFRLRHGSIFSGEMVETVRTMTGKDMAKTWEEASSALRLTSLVAEFGEIMNESVWAQPASLDEVFRLAQLIEAEFPGRYEVAELVVLIGQAARIQR